MIISQILVTLCFILIVILIMLDKINRAVVSLGGAIFCFFILIYVEGLDVSLIVGSMFGNESDNYGNLNSLCIILGMTIIVNICHEAGFFQYIAFKIVLSMEKKPSTLMLLMNIITFIVSAFINNILTVMIMIPLTITLSRILNIDPEPYIITQAILVNVGGTVFIFSSIPNILITTAQNISFVDYFKFNGIFSFIAFGCTAYFFYLIYKTKLHVPTENIAILKEFNPNNFIQSKSLLIKSTSILGAVIIGFIIIPNYILPNSVLVLIGAILLILISKLDSNTIIQKLDMELILYLIGIFIVAGAIEEVGVIALIGTYFRNLGNNDPLTLILIIIWISAILSATIDNIPITKVLMPVVQIMSGDFIASQKTYPFLALSIGADWGDNLTPMGDNILVMQIAKKNKRPIRMKEFAKMGAITTIFQLYLTSVYFALLMKPILGLIWLVISIIFFIIIIFMANNKKFETSKNLIQKMVESINVKLNRNNKLKTKEIKEVKQDGDEKLQED